MQHPGMVKACAPLHTKGMDPKKASSAHTRTMGHVEKEARDTGFLIWKSLKQLTTNSNQYLKNKVWDIHIHAHTYVCVQHQHKSEHWVFWVSKGLIGQQDATDGRKPPKGPVAEGSFLGDRQGGGARLWVSPEQKLRCSTGQL